jgi:hypothetical protein
MTFRDTTLPGEYGERSEIRLLKEILDEMQEQTAILQKISKELAPQLQAIEIRFGGTMQGPITLTPTAPSTKATVLGFDATGAPFTGILPTVTYTPDVTTFDTFTSDGNNGDDIVGTADGVTNFAASLTTAEGLSLSDTTTITTSGFTVAAPVLSSIKLDFNAAPVPAARRR